MAVSKRLKKLLLTQKYITYCIERELGLPGVVFPAHDLNEGVRKDDEVDKKAGHPIIKVTKESLDMIFGHYCGNPNCPACKDRGIVPPDKDKPPTREEEAMTKPTQQQRIDRLAEWMLAGGAPGWTRNKGGMVVTPDGWCAVAYWNPFASHDDAHLLLLECERQQVFHLLLRAWKQQHPYRMSTDFMVGVQRGLETSAAEITEAVWTASGLEEK